MNASEPPSSKTEGLSAAPASAPDGPASALRAGQRHCRHAGVGNDAGHVRHFDEDRLEATLGKAGPTKEIFEKEGAARHVLGVLEQTDVPGHEGRRREAHGLPEGKFHGMIAKMAPSGS
jgi:hypothetical protein